MRDRGSGQPRVWCRLAVALLVVLGGSCSEGGSDSTSGTLGPDVTATSIGESVPAIPHLTDQQAAELRARAIFHGQPPLEQICVNSTDPALLAALQEFYEDVLSTTMTNGSPDVGWDRCSKLITPGPVVFLRPDVVGIDVWVSSAPVMGNSRTRLFLWDGIAWVDATPEEVGVTVTTAVS